MPAVVEPPPAARTAGRGLEHVAGGADRKGRADGGGGRGRVGGGALRGAGPGENIQDKADNTTRFFVLGRKAAGPVGGGKDVTSLLVSLGDEAAAHSGALLKMLMPLAERGVNLSKIESRPSKKRPWDYYFFLDVSGHYEDAAMKAALGELRASCPMVKWLGSYPAAN